MPSSPFSHLPAFHPDTGDLNAVVEAIRGTRNKFTYDDEHGLFVLSGILAAGATFPFDFGFIPATEGDDGDPLDVLVLMDEPAFVGAVIPSRLIGAIEAEQEESDGAMVRNDRLIAVATKAHLYGDARALGDLPENLMEEIEHFWVSSNDFKGKAFNVLGRSGARAATTLVEKGAAARRSP